MTRKEASIIAENERQKEIKEYQKRHTDNIKTIKMLMDHSEMLKRQLEASLGITRHDVL